MNSPLAKVSIWYRLVNPFGMTRGLFFARIVPNQPATGCYFLEESA